MNFNLKKAAALLLCIAVIFGTGSLFAYAADLQGIPERFASEFNLPEDEGEGREGSEETPTEPDLPDEGETEEKDEENFDPSAPPSNQYAADTVAVFYLCSNWTGLPSLGHIWTYVENVSDEWLQIGAYRLRPGEGVSVGKFALTRSDGAGIYYNVESYTANLFGMENCLCLKTEMTKADVDKFSSQILRANFWDPIIFNCASFAIFAWNSASGKFIFPIVVFPFLARIQMKAYGADTSFTMFAPDRDSVYKQKGFGDSAALQIVSDGTLDTPPG